MKITMYSFVTMLIIFQLHLEPARAQSATDTDSEAIEVRVGGKDLDQGGSATPDPEKVQQAITERINKQLSEEQEKKLAQKLGDLNQLRKVFFGSVERITDETINISTTNGVRIINLSESTVIRVGTKKIKVSEIAIGNKVLVTGSTLGASDSESDSTIASQQILVYTTDPTATRKPFVTIGTIASISRSNLDIVARNTGSELSFELNSKTKFQEPNGAQSNLTLFEEDLSVLIVGTTDGEKTTATTIRSLVPLTQ